MAVILIIDDEGEFTSLVALRLRKTSGFKTLEAYDGEEGLKLAREKCPDLILLDVMLPKMDGFEVFTHLKEDEATKSIPVIVLTASVASATMEKFTKLGAACFIIKPFDGNELVKVVRICLQEKNERPV